MVRLQHACKTTANINTTFNLHWIRTFLAQTLNEKFYLSLFVAPFLGSPNYFWVKLFPRDHSAAHRVSAEAIAQRN
jgi:hypothetical protein